MNFLGLVRRDAAAGRTERLERDLDRIDTAADKLQRLLDELFELSRVGIQANPPEEVAFGDLVREALVELAGQVLPLVHQDRSAASNGMTISCRGPYVSSRIP